MTNSIKILADTATRIKYFLEISDLAIEKEEYLNSIKHKGFYKSLKFSESVSTISLNWILVHTCSFLDEYEKELTLHKFPEYSTQLKALKSINKPAIKRIKEWSDLKQYRNHILTHNLRIKGNPIFSATNKLNYNIPHTNDEIDLLSQLILIITKNIGYVFPNIVKKIDFDIKISDILIFNLNTINTKKEIFQIRSEINTIKDKLLNR